MSAQICETCKNKNNRCYCAPNSTCPDYEEHSKHTVYEEHAKHTVFDKFKSMNIDEFAEWLDEYGMFDNSPWMSWFDQKYCKNCEYIMRKYEDDTKEFTCSWCELNGNCKFFPDLDELPENKEIIKMWLLDTKTNICLGNV